jgi:hydroxymethylglutaryl-CoA reductase
MNVDNVDHKNPASGSRLPEFYKKPVNERLALLHERGLISHNDYLLLLQGQQVLDTTGADQMVENVIGVFGLPMGLGLNFLINKRDYVVPMVVEEPSIIAALSSAAKIARGGYGFISEVSEPVLMGQVQVVDVPHIAKAQQALLQAKEEILNLANSLHPKMVARGGGALDLEVKWHPHACTRGDMLVVHLFVNTCDAMGANLVNSMCEGIAPLVEKISKGKVFLRILSNLTDRSMVRCTAVFPTPLLAGKGYTGEEVRDGIVLANDFACADPYRAATHNKGIMNGVDAVALATGNDWRALEAGAHAYAARGSRYTSLTQWSVDAEGHLMGVLHMPVKVGTVGGNLQSNPAVAVAHRILGVSSARELAGVMGAVGLAQNFSALRALATEGIQEGHMNLHARSVVSSAGAPLALFDTVVEKLVQSGEIKLWKAQEILSQLQSAPAAVAHRNIDNQAEEGCSVGYGKVVLMGEHAVVYGSHALAAPIARVIKARIEDSSQEGVQLVIPAWGVEDRLRPTHDVPNSFHHSLDVILTQLGLRQHNMCVKVFPHIPRAMGLGGSAALAVAVIRALSVKYHLHLTDNDVNALAFESEKVAHGTPSGVDNAMATYGRFMLYQKGTPPKVSMIEPPKPITVVIGQSGVESLTAKMVADVARGWQKNKTLYEGIFSDINDLTLESVKAIERYDLEQLGALMNICQGLLNALQVSSWELEELIEIARKHGALGAKLTGGGGGGSMVALCPENPDRVLKAMQQAGYQAYVMQLGSSHA